MGGGKQGTVGARQYFVGVDLGQAQDPTAIAVLERAELLGPWDGVAFAHKKEVELRLRRLERVPLGMSYPEVEAYVTGIAEQVTALSECEVLVDATGVGRPVADHLRAAGTGYRLRSVLVTGGQSERSEGEFDYVPKRDLMAGLQVVFEYGELRVAKGLTHLGALQKEMAEMRVKVTAAGNEQFGAWRHGEHDDLVFAVALACWGAKRRYPGRLSGREAYWVDRRRW